MSTTVESPGHWSTVLPEPIRVLLRQAYEAERRVQRVYPGVVGEILAEELRSFIDTGCRYGGTRRVQRLVDDILSR